MLMKKACINYLQDSGEEEEESSEEETPQCPHDPRLKWYQTVTTSSTAELKIKEQMVVSTLYR